MALSSSHRRNPLSTHPGRLSTRAPQPLTIEPATEPAEATIARWRKMLCGEDAFLRRSGREPPDWRRDPLIAEVDFASAEPMQVISGWALHRQATADPPMSGFEVYVELCDGDRDMARRHWAEASRNR